MKKNKNNNDELDLTEIFFFVIKNKWKILLITTIATFLGYVYTSNKIPIYKVETEVRGISFSDEFMYQTYNSYINKKKTTIIASEDNEQKISVLNDFERIDKRILLDLFIDKLYDQQSLVQILKKSEYLNKENYQNSENYENAIKSLSSSIKLRISDDNFREQSNFFIETKTSDLKKWENLLIFIDKFVNEEIKNDIKIKFQTQLNSEKILKKYQIEDLKDEISNLTKVINDHRNNNNFVYELRELENQKKMLVANLSANKDIQRMKSLFDTTPIMNQQNEFYAAKIMYLNTKFYNINSADKLVIILVFGFIGFVISIFYIYIVNSFKNRK